MSRFTVRKLSGEERSGASPSGRFTVRKLEQTEKADAPALSAARKPRADWDRRITGIASPLERIEGQAQKQAAEREYRRSIAGDNRDELRAEVRAANGGRAVDPMEDMRREHESLTGKLESLRSDRARIAPVETWDVQPDTSDYDRRKADTEKLDRQISRLEARRNKVGTDYYAAKNAAERQNLSADPEAQNAYLRAGDTEDSETLIRRLLSDLERGAPAGEYQASAEAVERLYGVSRKTSGSVGQYMNDLTRLLEQLPDEQAALKKQVKDAGFSYEEMTEYDRRMQDAKLYADRVRKWSDSAREHPVLSSAASVLLSPTQGLDYLDLLLSNRGHNDPNDLEQYRPLDVYNMGPTNYVSTVRGTVSGELEKRFPAELFGQNVASFLYQTGMSVADSAAQVAAFGPAATYFMGGSAAANQAKNVLERGGSNAQALWSGLAAGAAEAFFEKFSVDQLLKPKTINNWKSLLTETAKQAGVEASEEMFTEVANILSDAAIMGDSSDFSTAVAGYMAQGMSEEKAKQRAFLDCIGQVVWAGAGGALSGGLMGGTVGAWNYAGGQLGGRSTANTQETRTAQERTASPRTAPDVEANGPQRGTEAGENGFHAPSAIRDADLTSAFGENGAQAYRLGWRGDMDEADYYRAFAHAYNAGAAGRSLDSLKDRTLTDAQRGAAFESGRSDADAAARKAGFTTVYGKDSGLVWDDYTKSMDQKVAGQVNDVAKRLGVKVRFADQVGGGAANGKIENGVITIARDAKNPVRAVFGHEITHRIQELAPEEYRAFREVAMAGMEYLDQNVEAIRELYAKGDQELSNLEAMDEIAADYAGRLMEDGALLDRFIQSNQDKRTLLEKLRDVFRSLADRLTGKYKSQARQAERRLEQALKAATRQAKSLQGKGSDDTMGATRYSLHGKYWRPNLNTAEWDVLNRHMQQEISDDAHTLDEATKWVYASEKGVQVFALYGIGDGTEATPLYAVGGKTAVAQYAKFKLWIGGVENGTDGNRAGFDRWAGSVQSAPWNQRTHLSAAERRGAVSGDDSLHAGASGRDGRGTSGAGAEDSGEVKAKFSLKTEGEDSEWDPNYTPPSDRSYRFYNGTDPMSEFGHAMFADNPESNAHYGENVFSVQHDKLTDIDSLMDDITSALKADYESGDLPTDLRDAMESGYTAEDIASEFDPQDIVDGAGAWDNGDYTAWFYERIAEPRGILGVKTSDGAIVFDRTIIGKEYAAARYFHQNNTEYSLKGSDQLTREIDRLMKQVQDGTRSEAEVRQEIRGLVDEVYQGMVEQYGSIKPGEKPAREVRVPRRTADDRKVSQTVRTILEAKATPDAAVQNIEELTATGVFSYETYTDKAAIADAENTIRDKGYATALAEWSESVGNGEVSKANTATGWALYNAAANAGDLKSAMTVLTKMVGHQRNAAQAVQATRILKSMSPEGQLYGVQRSVGNLQEELKKKYGKNAPDLRIDPNLAENLLKAKDQKARDEATKELFRDIGRQMSSRFVDKWNAWRYLAMLGNPRTHVRNILGNAFFAPVVAAKNMTATAIEGAVDRVSGGKLERTKGAVGLGKTDRALLSSAWADYANVQDSALGGGKYSDFANANQYIEEGRVIFRNKALEKARKSNTRALDAEDIWFSRPHYAYALAQYCKANHISAEQIAAGKGMDKARAYAIKEAQKATYRDTNALSQAISDLGRYRGKGPVGKGISTVMEGVLPFRKTPANILARGLEYSPAGLLKGLTYDLYQVRKGNLSGAEAIDHISAGMTGTGLLAFGAYCAAQCLVRGAGGDDKDRKAFAELQGHQNYALELPDGTSITLDWLAPEVLPFFIGVNLWEMTQGEKEPLTLSAILRASANVTEPLLEMSCLQSLNDVFDAVGYASSGDLNGLTAALVTAATSYLTQGVPIVLGQFERTGQEERMTTYTEKNAFLTPDAQYTLGRISGRIPGWDYNQIPYIDAWGRTERTGGAAKRAVDNFVNPAYTSKAGSSPMEDELTRLYDATGEKNVFPARAGKYFTVNGERKDLTAEEYVTYATKKGQLSHTLVTELTGSKSYQSMTDEQLVYLIVNARQK